MKNKRLELVLKHTDTAKKGIEIAPYHNPLLPKSEGYDVCILDVCDTQTLRANAARDSNIRAMGEEKIEEVDFVGDACNMGAVIKKAGTAGQFSYVLSSHNFEHLPNPIKFLQGAGVALCTGGVLSMAMPDYRCCFDALRLPTRLSDWLVAYHLDKAQPSPADRFDFETGFTKMEYGGEYITVLENPNPPVPYTRSKNLKEHYQALCARIIDPGPYLDTHCNVLFPELLELYLRDLLHLGLIDLELIEPPKTVATEIIVYLRKVENHAPQSDEEYGGVREELLRQITRELMGHRRNIIYDPPNFIKSWNRKRLARRRARRQAKQ